MAVISITITQSSDEVISGIPTTVTITSNIPSIIFFTLDGTYPSSGSSVYVSPIYLPSHLPSVTLTAIAYDGVNTPATISQVFTADLSSIMPASLEGRFPQSIVRNAGGSFNNSLFPFGTTDPGSNVEYVGVGNPDNTIFNEELPSVSNGYDADGNPTSFSNEVMDPFGSPTDINNKNVTLIGKNSAVEYTPEYSSNSDKLFNPKALVIYHDASKTGPLDPVIINRPHFSLENPETVKDGVLLSTNPMNTQTITGSFIKNHYNPNTGKMTSYYRDSSVNRWIISTWDYTPTAQNLNSFSNLVFGRDPGSIHVYPWILWAKRSLM